METLNKKNTDVAARKAKLDDVAAQLKTKFVGLDYIIDDVMGLVSSWYLFPTAQLRPVVINLWGLTGSGKTALVNALVDLLDYQKFYAHFDMGSFKSQRVSLKWMLDNEVGHFHGKQSIICLDEFQFARSIDNDQEVNNDKLRAVWDLVDSGKIWGTPDSNHYYIKRAEMVIRYLLFFRANGGMIKNGEVVEGMEIFINLFSSFFFDTDDRCDTALDNKYLKSKDFINGLMELANSTISREYVLNRVCACNTDELIRFITELMERALTPRETDFSRCLVFIVGNLDEAYLMSSNVDPDMSADDMHEASKKITVGMIKTALRKRFRSEQIARLGNNHFLYRAFSKAQFTEIIQRDLDRLADFALKEFGWKIIFDKSVVSMIYSEGVVPSQGTRPVFTTISNLVQARLGKLAMYVGSAEKHVVCILWLAKDESFHYELMDMDNNKVDIIKEELNLELLRQRTSVKPHIQAHTAVHESGHAILAALLWRILPSLVVSRTASPGSEGFCRIRFPEGPMMRDSLMIDIAVTLGGLAAEKIVFGKEFTGAGVGSDIEMASTLANDAIRRYGMGSDPIRLAVIRSYSNEDYFFDASVYEEEAIKLIRDCMTIAEGVLDRNKYLLLKMSQYLTTNSRMETAMIGEFIKKYSTEEWVNESGFIEPEEYYAFDKMIEEKIAITTFDSPEYSIFVCPS